VSRSWRDDFEVFIALYIVMPISVYLGFKLYVVLRLAGVL
jgi:hypothetical protein